jgi:hypothetical protein
VFEVRVIECALNGLVVVLGLDQVDAAEYFLGFAIRAVGGASFSIGTFEDPAKIGAEAMYFSTAFCISSGLSFFQPDGSS